LEFAHRERTSVWWRAAAIATLAALLLAACGDGGAPGRVIRFRTEDGVSLAGELRGSGPTGVVLAHMFPTDRTSWSDLATLLGERGYRSLAVDFRGYGDSGGERDIPEIWRDVVAAIDALRDRGVQRVVLVGASMGGTASLIAASRTEVQGVVTLSAAGTFMGLSAPPEVLQAVDEPKLFVAAEGDGSAAATAQTFYDTSSGAKRLEIVTGEDHGTDLLEGRHGEAVSRLIFDFLNGLPG
jgi:pimeloyl-ACP methyl ester carboxylesterase